MTPEQALKALGAVAEGLAPGRTLQNTVLKHTLLAEGPQGRFVLRIDHPASAQLGLKRTAELDILRHAHQAGFAPEAIAARTEAPALLLSRHLAGKVWIPADLSDPEQISHLGQLLRRLHHSGSEFIRDPSPSTPEAAHSYATLINTSEARQIAAEAVALCRPLREYQPVLCHRDPTAGNLLSTPDGRLMLLDWEYAALDDPYFDLAVVAEHHALPQSGVEQLLTAWAGGQPDAAAARQLARARQLYQRISWLWEQAVAKAQQLPPGGSEFIRE